MAALRPPMRARSSLLRAIWISVPPVRRQLASTSWKALRLGLRSVELDDQDCFRRGKLDEQPLPLLDGELVLISTAAGMMPAPMISDTAVPAASVDQTPPGWS